MFSGSYNKRISFVMISVIVKKNIPRQTALKYIGVLKNAGIICHIKSHPSKTAGSSRKETVIPPRKSVSHPATPTLKKEEETLKDEDAKRLGEYAWFEENSEGRAHPVGQKKPNALGLYDMHGNVWEWCQDWYGEYPHGAVIDPKGPPKGSGRVLRGASAFNASWNVRSALRTNDPPDFRGGVAGFRILKTR